MYIMFSVKLSNIINWVVADLITSYYITRLSQPISQGIPTRYILMYLLYIVYKCCFVLETDGVTLCNRHICMHWLLSFSTP